MTWAIWLSKDGFATRASTWGTLDAGNLSGRLTFGRNVSKTQWKSLVLGVNSGGVVDIIWPHKDSFDPIDKHLNGLGHLPKTLNPLCFCNEFVKFLSLLKRLLGLSWAILGPSWGHLGRHIGLLERFWRPSWGQVGSKIGPRGVQEPSKIH